MRQIDKNAVECPISLKPATEAFFQEGNYPDEARKTHGVRKEMVQQGVYIKEADALYKADDVKDKLETLYHNKCAYCEQHIESYHVEHYRPKRAFTHSTAQKHSGYHWLALSWDNLMLACPRCNEKKGNKFNISGTRSTKKSAPKNDEEWDNIDRLSAMCDVMERPLILNPERCNPEDHLVFSIDGSVAANTCEGKYTIEVCALNRKELADDRRKKVIRPFVKRLASIFKKYEHDAHQLEIMIEHEIEMYIEESGDIELEYTLFRKQSLAWIASMMEKAMESNKKDIQ